MDVFGDPYWNEKWARIISKLPTGGDYHYDLRQPGYNIIKAHIPVGSKVFDFACGLGIIDRQLREEKNCQVNGCDFSAIAVGFAKEITGGDFRVGSSFFGGPYDVVLAIQFLEHIDDPDGWVREALGVAVQVIVQLPNNFKREGEHTKMLWTSEKDFIKLFKGLRVKRLDTGKYPDGLPSAFKHPTWRIGQC